MGLAGYMRTSDLVLCRRIEWGWYVPPPRSPEEQFARSVAFAIKPFVEYARDLKG